MGRNPLALASSQTYTAPPNRQAATLDGSLAIAMDVRALSVATSAVPSVGPDHNSTLRLCGDEERGLAADLPPDVRDEFDG